MGRVIHFEITADDVARARNFYEAVFGWKMQQWDGEDSWSITTGEDTSDWGGINGSLVPRHGQAPTHDAPVTAFVCTISVDDLEASIHKVIEHGGNLIVDKREVPDAGILCYCKDTEGNMFGMIQPARTKS